MLFLNALIKHGAHTQGPTMHCGVGDKVSGPDMTAMVRLRRQLGVGCNAGAVARIELQLAGVFAPACGRLGYPPRAASPRSGESLSADTCATDRAAV